MDYTKLRKTVRVFRRGILSAWELYCLCVDAGMNYKTARVFTLQMVKARSAQ